MRRRSNSTNPRRSRYVQAFILVALVVALGQLNSGRWLASVDPYQVASRATPTAVAALTLLAASPPRLPRPTATVPPSPTPVASLLGTPTPAPSPDPAPLHGCPTGACPSTLEYAVNGCSCGGQYYDESRVTARFCCGGVFSDSECPNAAQQEARARAVFGATRGAVEADLVTVLLQGWAVSVHRKAAPAFRQVAARIENSRYRIFELPGGYNWQSVEGHEVLSLHSFGIAVDINPTANPKCGVTRLCECSNELITDMPAEFVQAFKDAGFEWGGDWSEHPDPMHFESTRW